MTAESQGVSPPSLVGNVIGGRYRLTRLLGQGGMGEVYAAEHIHITKQVAVKLLHPQVSSNAEAVLRFRQEAQSASSIGHDNIIRIDDFFALDDGRVCMCMEFLEGRSLDALLHQDGGTDSAHAIDIMCQVCDGLAAAHAKGIIHRDIKPDNVFLVPLAGGGERAKILDFGIAKVTGNEESHLTKTGTVFGTPHYMSPEQALGEKIDQRTDVYSVGVMLFELFTGQVPFKGESFMGVLSQHINTPPPLPSSVTPDRPVPKRIEEIILKALAKEPAKRFSTIEQLKQALADFGATLGPGGVPTRLGTASPHEPVGSMATVAATDAPARAARPVASATVAAREAPTAPPRAAAPLPAPSPAAADAASPVADLPKGGKRGLVVGLIAVLLVIGGSIAAAVLFWDDVSGRHRHSRTGVVRTSDGAGAMAGGAVDAAVDRAVTTAPVDATVGAPGVVASSGKDAAVAPDAAVAMRLDAAMKRRRRRSRSPIRRVGRTSTPDAGARAPRDTGAPQQPRQRDVGAPPRKPTQRRELYEVKIVTTPADAAVFQDGRKLRGRTPMVIKLRPGQRVELRLAKGGRKDKTVTVVGEQRDRVLRFRLSRRAFGSGGAAIGIPDKDPGIPKGGL